MAVPQTERWALAPARTTEHQLAREWEGRLRPRPRPRRRPSAWKATARWLAVMWALGLTATLMAVRVMEAGYRLDQLTARYQAAVQQNQVLHERLAQATSATALAAASQQLKVPVTAPPAGKLAPSPRPAARRPWLASMAERVARVLKGLRRAWLGR